MEETKKEKRIVKIARVFQALTYWPFYLTLKFFCDFKIYGQENLAGLEKKPIIFASNHRTYFDGPVSAATMPRLKGEWYPKSFFPIRFMALSEFFKWRYNLIAFYVYFNGSVKVRTGTGQPLDIVLKDAIKALKSHNHLWIFPEGRLSKTGEIQKGKMGAVYLHQKTKAPIVPVAIYGTPAGVPGNFFISFFRTLFRVLFQSRIRVYIGKPIYSLGDVSPKRGTWKMMRAIRNLFDKEGG